MKKTKKVKRIQVKSFELPPIDHGEKVCELDAFKVGAIVWFPISVMGNKFSWGTIREIHKHTTGKISITIWDEVKGMIRAFRPEQLLHEKPPRKRRKNANTPD
jgi:hypothetical protein